MITAIVRFKLPANVTLDAATKLFKGSAPKYQNLPGLIRKYYLYGEGQGGGVYLWKSRADAEKIDTAEWRGMIAERYGAEPEITFFEFAGDRRQRAARRAGRRGIEQRFLSPLPARRGEGGRANARAGEGKASARLRNERGRMSDRPDPPARIAPEFRNGSLTAISMIVGFSLWFLSRPPARRASGTTPACSRSRCS